MAIIKHNRWWEIKVNHESIKDFRKWFLTEIAALELEPDDMLSIYSIGHVVRLKIVRGNENIYTGMAWETDSKYLHSLTAKAANLAMDKDCEL